MIGEKIGLEILSYLITVHMILDRLQPWLLLPCLPFSALYSELAELPPAKLVGHNNLTLLYVTTFPAATAFITATTFIVTANFVAACP